MKLLMKPLMVMIIVVLVNILLEVGVVTMAGFVVTMVVFGLTMVVFSLTMSVFVVLFSLMKVTLLVLVILWLVQTIIWQWCNILLWSGKLDKRLRQLQILRIPLDVSQVRLVEISVVGLVWEVDLALSKRRQSLGAHPSIKIRSFARSKMVNRRQFLDASGRLIRMLARCMFPQVAIIGQAEQWLGALDGVQQAESPVLVIRFVCVEVVKGHCGNNILLMCSGWQSGDSTQCVAETG